MSSSSSGSGMHTPGAVSPLGMLSGGFNFGGGIKRSRGFVLGDVPKEKEDEEWDLREEGILESVS